MVRGPSAAQFRPPPATAAEAAPRASDESPFLELRHVEGWVVATLPDEIDLVNAEAIERALARLVSTGHPRIVLDAQESAFVDSSGLSALVKAHGAARGAAGDLRMARVGGHLARVIRVIGLGRLIDIYPTVEEALA